MPRELVEQWQRQNMKQAPIHPDIVTDFTPDMGTVIQQCADKPRPDLYLWVESEPNRVPSNMHALGCPTACYLINSHLELERHLEVALRFDYVFITQRAHLDAFRKVAPQTFWLPPACYPEVHRRWQGDKRRDVGFDGSVSHGSKREVLLNRLNEAIPVYYKRSFWDEKAKIFSESRLVFNNAVKLG